MEDGWMDGWGAKSEMLNLRKLQRCLAAEERAKGTARHPFGRASPRPVVPHFRTQTSTNKVPHSSHPPHILLRVRISFLAVQYLCAASVHLHARVRAPCRK